MTEQERIDYLVKVLEGNNAKRFSDKTGIATASLSKMRNGKMRIWGQVEKICAAYPNVNPQWLINGDGNSGVDPVLKTKQDYEEEIVRLKRLVDTLERQIRLNQKTIARLLK